METVTVAVTKDTTFPELLKTVEDKLKEHETKRGLTPRVRGYLRKNNMGCYPNERVNIMPIIVTEDGTIQEKHNLAVMCPDCFATNVNRNTCKNCGKQL